MRKAILVIYQDIDSGAKVVTEEILSHLRSAHPNHSLIIHQQNPQHFSGAFSAVKNLMWSLLDCVQTVKRHNHQVTVTYTPYFLAALVASLLKKPTQRVIFHFHGDQAITRIPFQPGWLGKVRYLYIWLLGKTIALLQSVALKRSDRLIFVAREAYQHITTKYHLNRDASHVVIVPNGVSTKHYHPAKSKNEIQVICSIRKKLHIQQHAVVLLYSGRIDEKKGIHHILSAMMELLSHQSNLHYKLIIMHPSYRDKDSAEYISTLRAIIKKGQLDVTFVSQPAQLKPYYQLADICLLPSEQEMMPLVMLESLACGTPFMGTKKGNVASVLNNIEKQLILKDNSGKSIASQIKWFSQLNSKQRSHIQELCLMVAGHYPWSTTAQMVLATILESAEQKLSQVHRKNQLRNHRYS